MKKEQIIDSVFPCKKKNKKLKINRKKISENKFIWNFFVYLFCLFHYNSFHKYTHLYFFPYFFATNFSDIENVCKQNFMQHIM